MKARLLSILFLAAQAQAADLPKPVKPDIPKRYLSCIYSVRESPNDNPAEDRVGSGDFLARFPKDGEYTRLRLEPNVELRMSVWDTNWLLVQLIYIPTGRLLDQTSAPLRPQDSPFSLAGAYAAPLAWSAPTPVPIQFSVACWPDETTHPWPPYAGLPADPIPPPAR